MLGVLVGCTGGGDDDLVVEEAPTVVGSWRVLHNAFDPDDDALEPEIWTFRDDNTLSMNGEETIWSIEGDHMMVRYGDQVFEDGFVVTDDRLLRGAFFPDGPVDGAIGNWSGDWIADGDLYQLSATLAADGEATVDLESEREHESQHAWGVWEEDGGASLHLWLDVFDDVYWYRLGERAIGSWLAERVE